MPTQTAVIFAVIIDKQKTSMTKTTFSKKGTGTAEQDKSDEK